MLDEAFRRVSKKCHPDKNRDIESDAKSDIKSQAAEGAMALVNNARAEFNMNNYCSIQ